jgi:ATP-dependent DNA helicase RecQ
VENHGELVPTEAARPILRGEQAVMMREELVTIPARGALRTRSSIEAPSDPRFAALRDWRKRTAMAQGVPAYVIFQDRTLAEIAAEQPATLDQLSTIPGVGNTKLERYGQDVLKVLRDHAA